MHSADVNEIYRITGMGRLDIGRIKGWVSRKRSGMKGKEKPRNEDKGPPGDGEKRESIYKTEIDVNKVLRRTIETHPDIKEKHIIEVMSWAEMTAGGLHPAHLAALLTSMKGMHAFGTSSKITRSTTFYTQRKRLAHKLGNPRIRKIGFHTFRHWKATMLYHETKDPLLVKEFLGHRNLDTTLLYIQLEKTLFKTDSDKFTVKAVREPEEIQGLLEVGFEYMCQKDSLLFFRKRK
jgi:integrase